MSPSNTMYIGREDYRNQGKPKCVIIEEPAQHQVRFRYECEGRSAGSIPGANSTAKKKTYPTIAVEGYIGEAVVVVSCVTKEPPFWPHPHNLVGRQGCKKGVCTVEIPQDTMTVSFRNLGIQCVKKKDIEDALRTREDIKVDPFRTGFSHRESPSFIDLNSVRLCFQVLLRVQDDSCNGDGKKFRHVALDPVVSNPIYHKKALSDLTIVKISDNECPVDGGNKDIILLCEKVAKDDIQINFFEEINGKVVWEALADFHPLQVHKQYAICFKPPRYKTLEVMTPVDVFIQLRRPSDGTTSAPVSFQMTPLGNTGPPPHTDRAFPQESKNYECNFPMTTAHLYTNNNFSASTHNFTPPTNIMVPYSAMGNTTSVSFYNIPPEVTLEQSYWKTEKDLPPITIDSGDLTMTDLSHRLSSNLSLSDHMMTCSS